MKEKEDVLISVVIPTYNRGSLLKRTINSVLNQTYSNFELIIIDDASTDNTEDLIKSYNDPRISYTRLESNSKGTKTRNLGIQKASGEFIALLDSDDEWVNNKLEKQLSYIKQFNSDKIICFTGLILIDENNKSLTTNEDLNETDDIMDYILLHDNWVQTSSYMISSKLAKNTLFGENIKKHQDWDFCLRLRDADAMFVYLSDNLTIYHIDKRDDRIGTNSKYHLSIEWSKSIKEKVSERAYFAFMSKIVANQLLMNGKKLEPLKIFSTAFLKRSINFWPFIKGIIKCILPWNYIIKRRS
ncbi:glycosyltransferase family 2 protein [Peribacillus simplex]|uniref:glycosyltransferase family 2 protein n=1 Tax=Peribacillus simplex TaxID=1478 RepID=UPI003CF81A64